MWFPFRHEDAMPQKKATELSRRFSIPLYPLLLHFNKNRGESQLLDLIRCSCHLKKETLTLLIESQTNHWILRETTKAGVSGNSEQGCFLSFSKSNSGSEKGFILLYREQHILGTSNKQSLESIQGIPRKWNYLPVIKQGRIKYNC